jgi:DNA-binding NtrC family response regulator
MDLEQINKNSWSGVKVLIIEDEQLVALDVEDLLIETGAAQVWCTGTLSEARQILSAQRDISVILLDLKLQDGCGEELLAELVDRKTAVIVTTGYATFTKETVPVIFKPYSTEALLAKIREVLQLVR